MKPAQTLTEHLKGVCECGEIRRAVALPLGAHRRGDGVNFALFSRHANAVWLELYEQPGDREPGRRIPLTPARHRTGDIWHIWVQGLRPGQLYAYRVEGPFRPEQGHRFDQQKLLLDPYATAITPLERWDFGPAAGDRDDAFAMPRCIVVDDDFDWGDDQPLRHPWSETVIYETHVRGFTIHSGAGVRHPGTYRGLMEKIPYLKELGITAVELMPVHEFNEHGLGRVNPLTGEELRDYWGYNTVGFFAPKASYSSAGGLGQQKLEFKEMVKALHQAGIEVILDVVFNHTAEGNELGPTLSFRGLDNAIYYLLEKDRRRYKNYTGTGNTLNAGHPVVRDFILDALRYWVLEMHVDGFRFDLASVLGRDKAGNLLPDAPLLDRIAEDPILRDTKLIAEAWDAAGAYQVGSFSERRWAEWNGRYRDEVRRFWRGDEGMLGLFASRLAGSADMYQRSGKGPECSINFITCHDGFTLNDLVSYNHKHNEANGEGNRDGADENYSANYGAEGNTDDPGIEAVRRRQIKNFLLTLLVSRGVPMLLGGDEFRRTQQGNNNAYCQDNEISWYDWSRLEKHQEIHRFARGMIALRSAHGVLSREAFYSESQLRWYNPQGGVPDWYDPGARCLACHIRVPEGADLFLIFNASQQTVVFRLPGLPKGKSWHVAADTSQAPPRDVFPPGDERPLDDQSSFAAGRRASAVLVARDQGPGQKAGPEATAKNLAVKRGKPVIFARQVNSDPRKLKLASEMPE